MDHEQALEAISAALDGELSEAEQAELDAHLAVCPPCRDMAAEFGILSDALARQEEVPAGLLARMNAALDAADAQTKKKAPWRRYTALAAALVLVVGLGVQVLDGSFLPRMGSMDNNAEAPNMEAVGNQAPGDFDLNGGSIADGNHYGGDESNDMIVDDDQEDGAMPETLPFSVEEGLKLVYIRLEEENAYPDAQFERDAIFLDKTLEGENTVLLMLEFEGVSADGAALIFALHRYVEGRETSSVETVERYAAYPNGAVKTGCLGSTGRGEGGVTDSVSGETMGEPEQYAIYGQAAFRVTYGYTPDTPFALVIGSAEELKSLLSKFPMDDLDFLTGRYGGDFFEHKCLVAVVVEASSGSIQYSIDGVTRYTVMVRGEHPGGSGTCDMAAWLLLAEVDDFFAGGEILQVQMAI